MNLSLISNLISLLVAILGFIFPERHLQAMGCFAFSGALTNWLAVYMLFERVPGIYGSGVVVLRFERFKHAIKRLMMEQFFTAKQFESFLSNHAARLSVDLDASVLVDAVDFNVLFNRLVDAILASSFGGMLGMFGGREALEGMRASCCERLKDVMLELASSDAFRAEIADRLRVSETLKAQAWPEKIETMIDARLADLTPKMVKIMVKQVIHEHLGWLVLWGAVFGGLLGGAISFLP